MNKIYTNQEINAMVQPLFETMAKRVSSEEMEIIRKAYTVALTAHKGQYRKSGDPYIFHPIAVARIVGEELGLGTNPVCAAFLHDVVEDTAWTIDAIEDMFGKDIAFLVKVVTKIPKAHYDETKQVDIHSQIGLHAHYARINGKLCSIKTELKNGDCVEIGTSDTVMPDQSWLASVSTYKAKRVLRTWFNSRPVSASEHCCHCHPLPGDEVVGFKMDDGKVEVHRRDCPYAISMASQHGDSVVAVDFQPDEKVLYPVGIHVRGVDRKHLLAEILDCISGSMHLSIFKLHTESKDSIVDSDISFSVHSYYELEKVITAVSGIESVDEVWQRDIA